MTIPSNPVYCEIPLTRGLMARVSTHRAAYLSQFKWYALPVRNTGKFYAARWTINPSGKKFHILMHREILGLEWGDTRQCDHIDNNGLNNTDENLRIASPSQNMINKFSPKGTFKGIRKQGPRWNVRIKTQEGEYHICHVDNEHDARLAYAVAAKILHGPFRHLSTLTPEQISAEPHSDDCLEETE